MISRTSSSAFGCPLSAMAPISQMIGRCDSRLVVPISSTRPFLDSTAISSSISWVRNRAMSFFNGVVSARPLSFQQRGQHLGLRDVLGADRRVGLLELVVVFGSKKRQRSDHRAGADAGDATELRAGPFCRPATRNPAPNAPLLPPPEMQR